jgi:hypothetical protein
MPQAKKNKKKTKKTKKAVRTKIILVPVDDISSEEKDREEEFDEGGIFLEKESVQLIYNALSTYKPTEREEHLHGVLLEEFEEILVVDYNEVYPDAN